MDCHSYSGQRQELHRRLHNLVIKLSQQHLDSANLSESAIKTFVDKLTGYQASSDEFKALYTQMVTLRIPHNISKMTAFFTQLSKDKRPDKTLIYSDSEEPPPLTTRPHTELKVSNSVIRRERIVAAFPKLWKQLELYVRWAFRSKDSLQIGHFGMINH
ncbi:unnamed protein product [Rhizophagus irregularis]|nr:unnamed protein product [Rhizophagus irregularis]